MRIADEINYVMREFVACEDLFNALIEEQGLELYQIASWMERNAKKLVQVPMLECNHASKDFRPLVDGWITGVLFNIRLDGDPMWDEDVASGFKAGWLKPELKEFFATVQVDFPGLVPSPSGQAATNAISASTFAREETLQVQEVGEKVVGTRERTTLLTVIAALAEEAKISLLTPSKSAELIAGITERIGAPVAKRTIEEHLKRVPDALERKSR